MGGRKSKRLNKIIRKNALAALFPILRDLGVQAALTHKGALALHLNKVPKEIKVVVNYKDKFTLEGLCATVVSRAPAGANGYFTRTRRKLAHQLDFVSVDPPARGKTCEVIFIQSGGSFPTILEDFSEIVYISEIPVLPVHAILLEQFITRSRLPVANRLEKGVAKFMRRCLVACGRTPLQQLSPLWRSLDVLHQIRQHVKVLPDAKKHWIARGIDPSILPSTTPWPLQAQIRQHVKVLPDAKKHWIARGIDPSIFPSTTPWPSQDIPDEDVDSDDGDSDLGASEIARGIDPSIFPSTTPWPWQDIPDEAGEDVDSDDGDSDLGASEDPSAIFQALNIAPEESDYDNWHSPVTDAAARHVVYILKGFGIECAVVGSTASQLYSHGETRAPEQLDILVLQDYVSLTPFSLKQALFRQDPVQFELKNKILRFSDFPCPSLQCQCEQRCKVEILLPGTAGLPNLTSSDVIWIDMLPVVPFLTLLLSKLQAWENDNSPAKARDVVDLLLLIPNLPVTVFRLRAERERMSSMFQQESEARVKRFCSRSNFPEAKPTWEMLGFDVESD